MMVTTKHICYIYLHYTCIDGLLLYSMTRLLSPHSKDPGLLSRDLYSIYIYVSLQQPAPAVIVHHCLLHCLCIYLYILNLNGRTTIEKVAHRISSNSPLLTARLRLSLCVEIKQEPLNGNTIYTRIYII